VKAAGIDQDTDLVIARDQLAMDRSAVEARRQIDVVAGAVRKLKNAWTKAAVRVATTEQAVRSIYRKSWSR
jgi:hypothetical protein